MAAQADSFRRAHAKHGSDSKKKVEDAVSYIKKKLDDSGWFDTVTTGDLKHITGKLGELNPAERNQVISKLNDKTLHKWADEVGSPWLGTGLNGAQKQALFDTLVPSLDGNNLTRLGEQVTTADSGVANHEFIRSVAMTAQGDARMTYADSLDTLEAVHSSAGKSSGFLQQADYLSKWDPQDIAAKLIDGKPNRNELVELTSMLAATSSETRQALFSPHPDDKKRILFTPERLDKLAERITDPDSRVGLDDAQKRKLFDVLSTSMTGEQMANMQSALTAHDFMRAMDANAALVRKTGMSQPMNSTDELGKTLENYTNKQSLQRAAHDPDANPVERWLAGHIGPHVPEIKAQVPDAPISPNGEMFAESILKNTMSDPQRKVDYIKHLSRMPVNPAQAGRVAAYGLGLAQDLVAERSAGAAYDSFTDEQKSIQGAGLQVIGQVAQRVQRIQDAGRFDDQFSTRENSVLDTLWLVDKYGKQVDQNARKFGVPHALLAGILASEVKFDTDFDINDPANRGGILGTNGNEGISNAHSWTAAKAVRYLDRDDVRKDLQDAGFKGALDYLGTAPVKKYLDDVHRQGADHSQLKDDPGPLSLKFAALITLKVAHEMWKAGRTLPESRTPPNFADFMKNMSASDMASVFRGYRAGSSASGGYGNYDSALGLYKVRGGDDFAKALNDPRAVMGYQAYQAEPFFRYYLALDKH